MSLPKINYYNSLKDVEYDLSYYLHDLKKIKRQRQEAGAKYTKSSYEYVDLNKSYQRLKSIVNKLKTFKRLFVFK